MGEVRSMSSLFLHADHDATATFKDKEGNVKVLEYERFCKVRYAFWRKSIEWEAPYHSSRADDKFRKEFLLYIKSIAEPIDTIYYHCNARDTHIDHDYPLIKEVFGEINVSLQKNHHGYHASCGYYASGFDKALVVSVDGGGSGDDEGKEGEETYTNVYHAESGRLTTKLYSSDLSNLGCSYGMLGCYMSEVSGDAMIHLAYAGKIMGLCAYGNVRSEWVHGLRCWFKANMNEIWGEYNPPKVALSNSLGRELTPNCFSGQDSYDLAATAQFVFEEVLMDVFAPYIGLYDNFVFTGGCALNVLFNQKLKKILAEHGKNLYIPANPNDCGLSTGMYYLGSPEDNIETYSGFDILDREELPNYVSKRNARKVEISDIVDLIKQGKIIGMVEGCSEVGPRALGNRSIICDPSFKDMKDTLNAKVKYREWYRPFAPVCRYEDMHDYFDNAFESEYMSYAPTVKEEYREKLSSVCHADNTARLQTVREEQHSTFYNILSELRSRDEVAVILNTSFNIKGMPILTTIEDALYCLDSTEMDYVVIEGWLFERKN